MKRSSHLFQFSAKEIEKAAATECEYHTFRTTFWKVEQEKAIEKAKAAGIELREYDVTGGKNVEVVLDSSITNRLSQCSTKIRAHQESADRFMIEAAAYFSQGDRIFEVDPDDVVYFRLAGGARED